MVKLLAQTLEFFFLAGISGLGILGIYATKDRMLHPQVHMLNDVS